MGRKYINKITNAICNNCPQKLYNPEFNKSIGTTITNVMIVIPNSNIDDKNSAFNILKEEYFKITSKDILEDIYITQLPKCNINRNYNIKDNVKQQCANHLFAEINVIKPKYIAFAGTYDISIMIKIKKYHNCIIYNMVNPLVINYDNKKYKEKFINQLTYLIQQL